MQRGGGVRHALGAEEVVDLGGVLRIDVVARALYHLDGRHQPVEGARHDRLAGATPARDHDAAHLRVDSCEEERRLDWTLANDEGERH